MIVVGDLKKRSKGLIIIGCKNEKVREDSEDRDVTTGSPAGGVLLDPFCGSGTTLMAAVSDGWDYIGIEREPEYRDIAEKRVAWAKARLAEKKTLFE